MRWWPILLRIALASRWSRLKTHDAAIQSGDVSIADTGWGQTVRKITSEEAEDRIEKLEKRVEDLNSFQRMNSMD